MKVRDFFVHHPDGSYEPKQQITVQGPDGKVTMGPGIRLRAGVRFMGVDILEILDQDIQIN